MARNRGLVRALRTAKLLESSRFGVSIGELASEFGCTTRTVRRDLEALQEAGLPLVDVVDGGRKRWRVMS